MPSRISAQVPDAGFLAAMPGYVPNMGIAVKLASVFPRNHDRGMPSHQALIALFDPDTGTPLCVMGGTYITAFRTAAAAALSAKLLAPRGRQSVGDHRGRRSRRRPPSPTGTDPAIQRHQSRFT